jgi:hypothetical protein
MEVTPFAFLLTPFLGFVCCRGGGKEVQQQWAARQPESAIASSSFGQAAILVQQQ